MLHLYRVRPNLEPQTKESGPEPPHLSVGARSVDRLRSSVCVAWLAAASGGLRKMVLLDDVGVLRITTAVAHP